MFKFTPQHDQMDCGPACLAMISSAYGKQYPLQYLRENSFLTREGVSLLGISEAAKEIGFETACVKSNREQLVKDVLLPAILHWNQNHFVVLYAIKKNIFTGKNKYKIADPGHGWVSLNELAFEKAWISEEDKGVLLLLNPTPAFYEKEAPKQSKISLTFLLSYLKPYIKPFILLFLMLLIGSGITLVFPFLTQNLIDKGVNGKNLNLIIMLLLAQMGLFLGSMIAQVVRNGLMLYIGTKVNIQIISDFLKKLVGLPIRFFDTKMMGDFNQRIQDHERIENFLTSESLMTFFSMITFSVFFGVLWYYDVKILLIYLVLTGLSLAWSYYFLSQRAMLDYYRFQHRSENQESLYELINGITELKLNQFEHYKLNLWQAIQEKLFKLNIKLLRLEQIQISGFEFINQTKNILITFLSAIYVLEGKMTLGELLSVSFILGQMNSPVSQLISFFRSFQDAKLSLERLNEVQREPDEEQEEAIPLQLTPIPQQNGKLIQGLGQGIALQDLSFRYSGLNAPYVLSDINLRLPEGKTTAIVGASGSGKTTLMKLLLKFYQPSIGKITFNGEDLALFSPQSLRKHCGVVMQDGFIFSDTIERNIATGAEEIDYERLTHAVTVANIEEFILSLPLGYKTKIGANGNGVSGGQKQRILIARAVYKNPHYIFFDEATSALDANNEKVIHENLQSFFKGKTVLIIAHRLSTVKNADQIIVLDKGKMVEMGTHQKLAQDKGYYYELIKNQLELGEG